MCIQWLLIKTQQSLVYIWSLLIKVITSISLFTADEGKYILFNNMSTII